MYAHPEVDRVFKEKWVPLMSDFFSLVCENEILLERVRDGENPLANLMTSMVHQAVPDTDFAIINHGAFRTTWFPGPIEERHFYAMFPFTNQLQTFSITGAELK